MSTRARIATVGQGGVSRGDVAKNREHVFALLDRALALKPDLVCLPESFTSPGVRNSLKATTEPADGPTLTAAAKKARENRCYIVCPIHLARDGKVYNTAVILDRAGQIAGMYDKVCPVTTTPDYTVMEDGVTPGAEPKVFNLDFGPIGIQICFDIGFPENWQALADKGAKLVFWPSAYDGGFPLWSYAYLHHFYVATAVRTGRSRIVDPCGEILRETDGTPGVIHRDINLDYVVSHLDFNMGIPDRIRARYSGRVDVRLHDPGSGHFIVEPIDPSITTQALREEFGFESSAQYHNRHRAAYAQIRQGKAPTPQQAAHGVRAQYGK